MTEVNYKSFVGPEDKYDYLGPFNFLVDQGLKSHHTFLDIGCGSVRMGKYLIPFLNRKKYYGLEPEKKWLAEGLQNEISKDILELKQPTFSHVSDFSLTEFDTGFNFVFARSVFIHCGVEQLKQCLSNLSPRMGPKTKFYISITVSDETVEYPYIFKKRYKYSSHQCVKYKEEDFMFILRQYNLIGVHIPPRFKSSDHNPESKFFLVTKSS